MPDRTTAPPVHSISSFKVRQSSSFRLENNIPVHVVKAGQHEIIRLEFIFRSGTWYEQGNGISFFTSKMLLEGTDRHKSEEIADLFESKGAHVHIKAGVDLVNISLYILKDNYSQILPLIKECLTLAAIPAYELEILKNIQIQHVKVNNQKNDFLASRQFRKQLYGDGHPYGRDLDVGDINKINRASLIKFFREHFNEGPEIIISGNVDDSMLKSLDIFSDIEIRPARFLSHSINSSKNPEEVFNKKDSLQSSIRYGRRIMDKKHPDYFKVLFLNEILGGFFGSRLMRNIREDKGYTYGVHSRIVSHIHDSYWVIGTDVKKEYTRQTLQEINYEFRRLRNVKVKQDELDLVKNYLRGSFLSSLETSFSLADKFKSIYFHGLDYSFYDRFFRELDAITAEDIIETSRYYLNKDKFYLSIVGGTN